MNNNLKNSLELNKVLKIFSHKLKISRTAKLFSMHSNILLAQVNFRINFLHLAEAESDHTVVTSICLDRIWL